jgi:hypothetical protein
MQLARFQQQAEGNSGMLIALAEVGVSEVSRTQLATACDSLHLLPPSLSLRP